MLKDFGIGFSNITPLEEVLAYAELAENNGLDFWLNEGYHNRSSVVLMSAIASRTRRIKLGLGIISPVIRHPYLIAMEAGSLDELSKGRLVLGLGLASSGAKKHNVDVTKIEPVEMMRESAEIVRRLIAGETVTSTRLFEAGETGVKLAFTPPRKHIPLYLGAMHSKMLSLAGECFDGVIFNYACPLPYVDYAMKHVSTGLKKATMQRNDFRVSALILLSVSKKRTDAVEASRQFLPHYLSRIYPITMRYAGISKEEINPVIDALKSSDHKGAVSKVSDEVVSKLTISGNPEECVDELMKYERRGVTGIIAEQIMGPNPMEAIGLIADQVARPLISQP